MQKRLKRAQDAVDVQRMTIRDAAERFHIPKSTLHDSIQRTRRGVQVKSRRGRTAFSACEEDVVVKALEVFSDHGTPLTQRHLQEAFATLISTMSDERKKSLPFKNEIPGKKFCRLFLARHKERLRYCVQTYQSGVRWTAVNAETLTTHFATLENLVKTHQIDATRIWNLDETDASPGGDANGKSKRKRVTCRLGPAEYRLPIFTV